MSEICSELHRILARLERHRFPFEEALIPQNGLYMLFESGEHGHGGDRVVRVGTHTGENQLRSRLFQHFTLENKDRSIFRKNIGRALLGKDGNSLVDQWEIDLTTREAREKHAASIDPRWLRQLEQRVTEHIQTMFSFCVVSVPDKQRRLILESRILSTISLCQECRPSPDWLGNHSPKERIRRSGLWNINELFKKPLDADDLDALRSLAEATGS
ncbi:MAG TPA: hypothetical protein PKC23_08760 [Candidatus Desulfobacillus sp.]|nr:hypothetical protein [Candidatus Desulfobacillus sp.]